MKIVKTMIVGLAAAAAGLSMASAQQQPPANLSEFIQNLRDGNQQQNRVDQQRLQEFREQTNQQRRLLAEAEQELADLFAREEELTLQRGANDSLIEELGEELEAKQGEFRDVFTQSRNSAGELQAIIESSLVSAQIPGRTGDLTEIAESATLQSRENLDTIWITYLEEMEQQRKVVTFDAVVNNFNGDGLDETVSVTRVGTFIAVGDDRGAPRFLQFQRGDDGYALAALERNPPNTAVVTGAKELLRADENDTVVRAVYDPSRGDLLGLLVQTSTLEDRIEDGGIVGLVIIGLTILGLLFGAFRLFQLIMLKGAVDAQARRSTPSRGNPLGRIMMAAEDARGSDVETFEFQLDNAIIRESSGIDFGLNMLKLLAAVAPLLGLLGTVTGMIQTFEVIKLFGAGDPQQMAGGISQALVTTVLGLIAAIPLLFIHSFCAAAARAVQQVLEEQAVSLVAEQALKTKGRG